MTFQSFKHASGLVTVNSLILVPHVDWQSWNSWTLNLARPGARSTQNGASKTPAHIDLELPSLCATNAQDNWVEAVYYTSP